MTCASWMQVKFVIWTPDPREGIDADGSDRTTHSISLPSPYSFNQLPHNLPSHPTLWHRPLQKELHCTVCALNSTKHEGMNNISRSATLGIEQLYGWVHKHRHTHKCTHDISQSVFDYAMCKHRCVVWISCTNLSLAPVSVQWVEAILQSLSKCGLPLPRKRMGIVHNYECSIQWLPVAWEVIEGCVNWWTTTSHWPHCGS